MVSSVGRLGHNHPPREFVERRGLGSSPRLSQGPAHRSGRYAHRLSDDRVRVTGKPQFNRRNNAGLQPPRRVDPLFPSRDKVRLRRAALSRNVLLWHGQRSYGGAEVRGVHGALDKPTSHSLHSRDIHGVTPQPAGLYGQQPQQQACSCGWRCHRHHPGHPCKQPSLRCAL